ncbi:hypothetical protein [Desulfovibrio inopinatus]|uniref:hypothetical protein n=1 Tax=Desulfovibrio inopinatus TaxID=102109 RepID=UPI00068510FC|nr:hypothetical protein [Desulfovibrio inopinatus]
MADAKKTRKAPDWERIEREYRAGLLSVREIASQHGTTHASINRHAKKYGWTRDVSESIRRAAKTKSSMRSTERSTWNAAHEREIIEEVSDFAASVIKRHQHVAADLQDLVSQFAQEVKVSNDRLSVKTKNLNNLVQSLDRLVKIERQALNLDDTSTSEKQAELEKFIDDIADRANETA